VLLGDGAATVINWVALPTSAVTGSWGVAGGSALAPDAGVVDRGVVRSAVCCWAARGSVVCGGATVVVLVTVVGGGVRVVLAGLREAVLSTVVGTVAVTVTGAGVLDIGGLGVGVGVVVDRNELGDGAVTARLAVVSEVSGLAPESAEQATDSNRTHPRAAIPIAGVPVARGPVARIQVELRPVRSCRQPRRVTMPR